MTSETNTNSAYWRGFRAGAPFVLVVAPFGLLFGVVGMEAGLNLLQVMSMTMLIIAGAAQFTALALMAEEAPTIIVILTALAVNMRMAMYSAAIAPYIGKADTGMKLLLGYFLTDQAFAVSTVEFEQRPELTVPQRVAFILGSMSPLAPMWFGGTFVGAMLGTAIPPEYSLDFAIPICFIAITAPMLRTLPHVVAACVSIAAALALVWVPYSLGLIIAAFLAMIAGVRTEHWLARRQA
ncbi:MAG: branched-chain amino acid ABC transporter permease [Rhodobacteraceae bacterium]|nr:branched-chain amino acid ABC transporter permease [Paracoccaceae bacterium]